MGIGDSRPTPSPPLGITPGKSYAVSHVLLQDWAPGTFSGDWLSPTPSFPPLSPPQWSTSPGVTSQINYVYSNPCLRICFGGHYFEYLILFWFFLLCCVCLLGWFRAVLPQFILEYHPILYFAWAHVYNSVIQEMTEVDCGDTGAEKHWQIKAELLLKSHTDYHL